MFLILKYVLSAAFITLISELAKRSDRLGAFIGSLPFITIFTLIWLKLENQENAKIENHAFYTFWYVLPTLPMFLVFPALHRKFNFWIALFLSCALTVLLFGVTVWIGRKFKIDLL
ncbi:DUF3147 family protein [Leptospira sanjuanensis]|uniref:DUF3147 family protein n=1 Tax=Leptospira sanjuanensis TaxID=2879643 RepID=UPI001EE8D932|nr:DUF3147 family protein [Leptospira sanjuanensis]MCG6166511.1 DUF3147 family protein [Leptospira sanjuanensis]